MEGTETHLGLEIPFAQASMGRWRLVRILGRGGMGTVYEALADSGERAAIKVLSPALSASPNARARFAREGRVANAVGHPDAARVLDVGVAPDGRPFLVMELLDGQTLQERLAAAGHRLPVHEVVRVAIRVLDVLAAAHDRAIVHRDIKPGNVFLTIDGAVKILDFGVAAVREGEADASLTQSGASLGTPAFMAPEQARGRHAIVGPRTDVWAVGATMFACLAGRRVHGEATTANEALIFAATQRAPSVARFCPSLPAAISGVVDRALELDPEARWSSARAMREALERAAGPELARDPSTGGIETLPEATSEDRVANPGVAAAPRRRALRAVSRLTRTLSLAGLALTGLGLAAISGRSVSRPPAALVATTSPSVLPAAEPPRPARVAAEGDAQAASVAAPPPAGHPADQPPLHPRRGPASALAPSTANALPSAVLDRRK